MILLLDNYDSFTYNIVQYLEQLNAQIVVYKNDAIDIKTIEKLQPQALVLGPGPGTPDEAGITLQCINHFAGKLPILGVCLGHQAIAQAFGASIIKAEQVMHGRTSLVHHKQTGIFTELATPTTVTRYHSLIVDKTTLPDTLEVTGWTTQSNQMVADSHIRNKYSKDSQLIQDQQTDISRPNNDNSLNNDSVISSDNVLRNYIDSDNHSNDIYEIMAIRHKQFAIEGVQFHPESILSDAGLQLFNNFLQTHQLIDDIRELT